MMAAPPPSSEVLTEVRRHIMSDVNALPSHVVAERAGPNEQGRRVSFTDLQIAQCHAFNFDDLL
jgi:hypothetical protein